MSDIKVIFLDVDGVLSSFGVRGLCSTRLDLFADIVHQTGAEVVLSSTWRRPGCRDQRLRLLQELGKRNVELFGETPILDTQMGTTGLIQTVTRATEITAWLTAAQRRHHITTYVILDDDPHHELVPLQHALVKCDGYEGLTRPLADQVIQRLTSPLPA